ncbi:MAG: hypothetical protein SFX73_03270 [Kofleriaceae bacterium]|nr:hypothetical protein [Kofleriaceae bacterium]
MSRWPLLSLLVLAACPKKNAELNTPREPGIGCPSAGFVYMATYVAPPEGEQGYTGWVLPLHDVAVPSVQGQPGFTNIDPAAALAAGVPAPPVADIWLAPPHAELCKVAVGRFYAAAIDGKAPNIAYGVELTGCPAPKDPSEGHAIAMVSAAPPTECKLVPPKLLASRLGELDPNGTWTPPTKETAMPDAFAALVPTRECTAPTCEKLWSVAAVEEGGATVAYGGAVNWVTKAGGACPWSTEAWSGFFIPGPDGALTKVTAEQDHPLALTVLLTDSQGRKVLVAQGPGEYTTYDVADGTATVGRHLVWLREEPEAYEALDHLGPDCPSNSGNP